MWTGRSRLGARAAPARMRAQLRMSSAGPHARPALHEQRRHACMPGARRARGLGPHLHQEVAVAAQRVRHVHQRRHHLSGAARGVCQSSPGLHRICGIFAQRNEMHTAQCPLTLTLCWPGGRLRARLRERACGTPGRALPCCAASPALPRTKGFIALLYPAPVQLPALAAHARRAAGVPARATLRAPAGMHPGAAAARNLRTPAPGPGSAGGARTVLPASNQSTAACRRSASASASGFHAYCCSAPTCGATAARRPSAPGSHGRLAPHQRAASQRCAGVRPRSYTSTCAPRRAWVQCRVTCGQSVLRASCTPAGHVPGVSGQDSDSKIAESCYTDLKSST